VDRLLLTQEFFVRAIVGGIAGNASYDLTKAAIINTMRAFRRWLPHCDVVLYGWVL
jgi:hypothetical protein